MRYKKGISIILLMLTMIIGVCGCKTSNTDNPKDATDEVVLNERQKEILADQGLSTEYEELSSSQKTAIVSIENMLKYAEDKYSSSFNYAGYIAESTLEPAQLKAYPASGSKAEDCFTVVETDDGYIDDYVSVFSSDFLASYILSAIEEVAPGITIKVYAEITETSLSAIPDDGSAFDGTTEAAIWVFVDGAACPEDDFINLIENSKTYLSEHQLYSSVQFIRMKDDKIKFVTGSNFEDFLSEEHDDARENIYIN